MTTPANDGLAIATLGVVEFTATSVDPTAPTITAAQLTTTSIRVTIDGDAGATNTVYYRLHNVAAWTTGSNRSGDGTVDITGLTLGSKYQIIVQSDNTNSLSVMSNEAWVTLQAAGSLIEQGFYAYISNESGVTDLVSTRIYPEVVPQNTAYPAMTYQKITSSRNPVMTGSTGLVSCQIQLNVWDDDYDGAKAILEAVRLVLDGYKGAMGNVTTQSCLMVTGSDNDLPPVKQGSGSQIKAYGVSVDYEIWYEESKPNL